MTGPVGSLLSVLHNTMVQSNEFPEFMDEKQRAHASEVV